MKLTEAWKLYLKDKKYMGYSPVTLESYSIYQRKLIEHIGDKNIDDVTYLELKGYVYKISEHLATSSVIIRIRQMKSFFNWANDEGIIDKNEASRVRQPKKPESKPKPLTMYEIESLRDECKTPSERATFEFMYATGCRVGEMIRVNREDVNWNDRTLVVLGKGSKTRTVYFDLKCDIWLKKYLETREDNQNALFVTERKFKSNGGKPRRMSTDQIRWILKRLARKAGIVKSIYPHNMRHSFAMNMLENGAPMEAIQEFLGHADPKYTEVYAQLTIELKKGIYDKYHR